MIIIVKVSHKNLTGEESGGGDGEIRFVGSREWSY